MVVDAASFHICNFGDFAHGRGIVPFIAEKLCRRREDRLSRLLGLTWLSVMQHSVLGFGRHIHG